jgi:ribosomal-protein-alanine N-acetyltransferase
MVLMLTRCGMIVVRKFSPTDIASVSRMVQSSLGETYPPSLYLTIHSLWPDGFLMLSEDSSPVGFVAAVISGPKVARVLMLAVEPVHRRRSLGTMLMDELFRNCLARGVDTVVLEVRKSNASARKFYERLGFAVFGEIRNFYTNGESADKMMKVLQS